MISLDPGLRAGTVTAPPSKSHAHRLLIANFLAGARDIFEDSAEDSADIRATRRCLRALDTPDPKPVLDCGESGSTLRFLAPVAAALGKTPIFLRRGRLAERPFTPYPTLNAGEHTLAGDVSSQFVTGLLFALPRLAGNSRIRFTSPLESRGYVTMTLAVLRKASIVIHETANGFDIPGGQHYAVQDATAEGDWSGAAFWLAMNALGCRITVNGLAEDSAQPDRAIVALLARLTDGGGTPCTIDVAQCPDIFPVLTVVAAAMPRETRFTGIRRLRLKECDRVTAMKETLTRFGRDVSVTDETFAVQGTPAAFSAGEFRSFGDHRIAMSVAVGAVHAAGPTILDNSACAAKSYPAFFDVFASLERTRP